jgi:pyridoxamine 5'-phosphate oxidase
MLADLRRNYTRGALRRADLDPDPVAQFRVWLDEACAAELPEPNAMVLATVGPTGQPSARAVLLKGLDERGFHFFTNYESRKAHEIAHNPLVALVFNWLELERQVRVEGRAVKLPREDSEAYHKSRPYGSQLSAWVSPQSRVIANREELEARQEALRAQFPGEVPLPDFWGGYAVAPSALEFWQGRPDRLHDRFRYTREGQSWRLERLAP